MKRTLTVTPYFNLSADGEQYIAGLRDDHGRVVGVGTQLDAAAVELIILGKARLGISIAPNGVLSVSADGLSDNVWEAAQTGQIFKSIALSDAVRAALDPELLTPDDDAGEDLIALCRELERSLDMAKAAVASRSSLKKQP